MEKEFGEAGCLRAIVGVRTKQRSSRAPPPAPALRFLACRVRSFSLSSPVGGEVISGDTCFVSGALKLYRTTELYR